jgi:transcriptional regulator with XRE-family HTH domain
MDGIIAEPGRSEKQAEESWKGSWTYTSIFLLLDTGHPSSQGVVSEILSGKRDLNVRQITQLAARFGVSPALFIPVAKKPGKRPSSRTRVASQR